jgi:hypothetical protein
MNTETKAPTTTFVVHFDDVSAWLTELGSSYHNYQHSGWQFVTTLQAGIDQFGSNKAELYEAAADQTDLSTKTLQNYVSMARKPSSKFAASNGLEIGHAVAVLGVEDLHAVPLLRHAKVQRLSVESLRAVVRDYHAGKVSFKPDFDGHLIVTDIAPAVTVPDDGNRTAAVTAPNHATDDDPPFARTQGNVLYESDDLDAKAERLAGSSAAYDFSDDEDTLLLTINEARDAINRAMQRLSRVDDGTQRALNEWLRLVAQQTY